MRETVDMWENADQEAEFIVLAFYKPVETGDPPETNRKRDG